jgi:LacI family transcriptional regulator
LNDSTGEGTFVAAANVRDVARHAGVSVGTVSNVLNRPDKVLPETVARVQASIAALGFIRNDAARQLRAGRSKSVGLIVLDVRNPFFTDLARGAEDRAAEFGLSVILGNSDEDANRETAYLDLFEEQRVHGVLISPRAEIGERLSRLRDRGIPAVLVDRSGDDGGFSSVSVDDVAGGRLAVEHLLDRGRTRIAFVAGSVGIRQVEDRLAGARAAVDSRPGATLEVIEIDGLTVLAGRAAGEMIARRAPHDRPDGVFAANDLVAMGVLQALVMQGDVRVPEQIALVGYDDIDFAAAAVVPLTSIRQPSREIGSTAMQIVMEEAADSTLPPRRIVFQPELVVRASTVS